MTARAVLVCDTSCNKQYPKCLSNIHNQVKDTPHLIANCLQLILTRNNQPITQHDYLTKMANAIIYEDTRVAMEYIQLI